MGSLLIIGMRNLLRRKRRSLVTWLMLFFGTALTVYFVGMAEGTYRDMISIATRSFMGMFQVQADGYLDKPSLFGTIADADAVAARLRDDPLVVDICARVETGGLLSAEARSAGAMLVGVEPDREARVTTLSKSVSQGRWLPSRADSAGTAVLLGEGLARRLRLGLGDQLSFVGQAADGSIAAELFTVRGLLHTGSAELDGLLALVHIETARELLVLEGRAHRLVGSCARPADLPRLQRQVQPGDGNVFLDWKELMPELHHSIRSDKGGLHVFIIIILVVVLLGVTNTMLMAVLERTREFGVMIALGSSPGRIVAGTLLEAFWISMTGVIAGLAAGSLLIEWGAIPMGDMAYDFGGVRIDTIRPRHVAMGFAIYPTLIFLSGILAGLLPALRAARLSAAEAMRRH